MDQNLNQPLISVIMPVYNAGPFVKQAIESVLAQSYKNFELIILNDGSTDNSEQVILSFSDNRIRYTLHKKNVGLIACLNEGVRISNGTYIARMDADDISLLRRFEKQLSFLEENLLVGICGTQIDTIREERIIPFDRLPICNNAIRAALLFRNVLIHPSVMFRKSIFQGETPFDSAFYLAEDYECWSRMAGKTEFVNLSETLLHYRIHSNQVSTDKSDEQQKIAAKIRNVMLKNWNSVTESELHFHKLICLNKIKSKEDLLKVDKWFHKLLHLNAAKQWTDESCLKTELNLQWKKVCMYSGTGIGTFSVYQKSSFASKDSITEKARILLRMWKHRNNKIS